ncbi:peptidase S13, D-Ala-D-Ala carboxypeptidase C [Chondrocystis sp. NIES-4102]|nr:peptidase S13, D-Ala-D-Ala carboxypeptidase C [Chondrocystis sp. NIES-4102]
MLDIIATSLFAWLNIFRASNPNLQPLEPLLWENAAIFSLPMQIESDRRGEDLVKTYLKTWSSQGINSNLQGIWMQSDWLTPVNNQGRIALPAASLTKIATTLAAIKKWGAKHQFITEIYITGTIKDGIVEGDLIILGSGDPFFVWEEAIALGNSLESLGIKKIQGNLLINRQFYMNYQEQAVVGKLFKEAINRQLWQSEVTQQYLQMPTGTAKPEIAIALETKIIDQIPATAKLVIRHQSLPLAEILRQMNIYSNNKMAQMLADLLGGAEEVAKTSALSANFPIREIQLVNGSGLGEDNRISPYAVCQMLMAIEKSLEQDSLNLSDLFPTAGKDVVGTLKDRALPVGTTIKTGTLDNVSALAGVMRDRRGGQVYFTIINYGRQVDYFRQQQDKLLNELVAKLELIPQNVNLTQKDHFYLGDPQRNLY